MGEIYSYLSGVIHLIGRSIIGEVLREWKKNISKFSVIRTLVN